MDVTGVLAIILIFGGGTAFLLAVSPVGRAIADRIRHGTTAGAPVPDPAVYEELDRLRQEMAELAERVDFTERLLARAEPGRIPAEGANG